MADDAVELRCRAQSFVIGTCPELTRHHMEIRGLGLINVQDLFGVASTRTSKRVELVVQLERWEPGREYDRLGIDDEFYETLGIRVPMVRMPVAPGRNVAILVEVAARNQLLRSRGHHAARRLVDRIHRQLDPATPDAGARHRSRGRVLMREKRHAARRAARTAVTSRFVVLTGLAGSGKSQAIKALEDLGYFCVDNLPVALLPTLADLTHRAGSEIARAAVVVDVREGKMLEEFPRVYKALKRKRNLNPVLIFLEAAEPTLVRRFSETRRPHPLAHDRSAIEGIREERKTLARIRKLADHVVDTSEMTVHELRHAFTGVAAGRAPGNRLIVTILSFGFKNGIPVDLDLLFDVRFLPNPHFVPELQAADRARSRRRRVPEQVQDQPRVPHAHAEPAEVPRPAVRHRRQDISHDRHRMHRRTSPFGRDRRSAEEGTVGPRRGPHPRTPSGHCK